MQRHDITQDPGRWALITELQTASHTHDLTGVRQALRNLECTPPEDHGKSIAVCWMSLWGVEQDHARYVDLGNQLENSGLCTDTELTIAMTGWIVNAAQDRGYLTARTFDLISTDPLFATALRGVTRIP